MTALVVVGIVLTGLGALLLLAGVLYPAGAAKDGVAAESSKWDVIASITKFVIWLVKQLLGEKSIQTKVLILGLIFFGTGVALMIVGAHG